MEIKFSSKKIFAFLLILLAFSCSQKPARIIDNKDKVYQKSRSRNNSQNQFKGYNRRAENSNFSERNLEETRIEEPKEPAREIRAESSQKQIEVKAGDTLYSISRNNNVTLSDLIKYNSLTPPYILKVGSRLNAPIPTYHEVKSGETLYAISRLHQMKIDQLIEMNNLKKPYAVKVGDKIRISNSIPTPTNQNSEDIQTEEKKEGPTFVPLDKIANKSNRFSWPLRGQIISKFGPKSGGLYNDGINIKANQGSEVKAAEDGAVAYVGNELKGYGNLIIIKHSGGWITAYAHLDKTLVKRGGKINKGQRIATVGSTGNVTSPQLYFGLRKGRDAVNPQNYLQ